jgi:hypothetical protein
MNYKVLRMGIMEARRKLPMQRRRLGMGINSSISHFKAPQITHAVVNNGLAAHLELC